MRTNIGSRVVTIAHTNRAGTFDDTERTITMDAAKHNGYADLLITEKPSSTTSVVGQDDSENTTWLRACLTDSRYPQNAGAVR